METILLLFLLSTLDKDSDLKRKLQSFLCFYRENREMISMLAGGFGAAERKPEDPEKPETPHEPREEKESRPPVRENDSVKILEEYLKRSGV